jgi:flagellar hook-associated protein 3 FlgL
MGTQLNPSSAIFLANVNRIEQRIAQANSQVSSGNRINVASDSPDQVQILLQLRTEEQKNTQIESNLTLADTDATTADSTLSSAISLMDRALQLATEGANSTQTADTRTSIAQEVASIQTQMVALSQTQVQGQFIFSGDQPGSATYQADLLPPPDPTVPVDPSAPVDPATLTGVDQLSAAPATQQVEDPAGGSFAATQTAQTIFDDQDASGNPSADNVFAALNSLRIALLNNDQTGITNSITSLNAASLHLNNMEAFYGGVENRIQDANTFAQNYETQLKTEISNIQDADIPTAATELTQGNIQLQAAFQMQGQMPSHTLFDYLA